MKRALPWGRAIAGVIAVAGFAVGFYFLPDWWQFRSECADAEAAELAVFTDVFGDKGTYQTEFAPKYDFTCTNVLVVEYDPPSRSHEEAIAVLEGLKADLQILDKKGKVALQADLTKDGFHSIESANHGNTFWPEAYLHRVAPGDYQISLTVHEPASNLTEIQHRVVARYGFCGIEYIALAYVGAVTLAGFLVGAILVWVIVAVTRKKRSKAAASSQGGL